MKSGHVFVIVLSLIFALLFLQPVIAVPSQSDFIPLSSSFYDEFDTFMRAVGRVVSQTRPYTYGEAGNYLALIEPSALNDNEKRLYDYLVSMTETLENRDKVFAFNAELTVQPETYIHYNTGAFRDPMTHNAEGKIEYLYTDADKFLLWNRETTHLLDGDLSLSIKDYATLFFQVPVTNTVHTGVPSGSSIWMTNIPFLASPLDTTLDVIQDFSMNFPYRAYLSVADSWYSIQLGRERLNYGSGKTGNFVIDGSLPYHNAFSLSFFSESFKYTFLLSFFPHPSQYIDLGSGTESMYGSKLVFDQYTNAFTGLKFFMSHRFDWTMDGGRHRFAITEGIMYQNDNGVVDLQVLNPMMFFHNMYIAGNSNSILQLEWDMVLAKGVVQHIAIAIDDLNIPFEGEDGTAPRPNAFGIQYGISTTHVLGPGFIESDAEVTYMSPYFYLRDGRLASAYPLDFAVAIRNQRSGEGAYDLYSIGYPNGGDQTIALVSIGYRVPQQYSAKLGFQYRLIGTNNLLTIYDSPAVAGKEMGHSFSIKASGGYHILSGLEIRGALEGRIILNYANEPGRSEHDLLFTLGLKYTM